MNAALPGSGVWNTPGRGNPKGEQCSPVAASGDTSPVCWRLGMWLLLAEGNG